MSQILSISGPKYGVFKTPILNGEANFPLCLAPMVGLSHVALRMVLREYLPGEAKTLWPTEMLNSRKLPQENLGSVPETAKNDLESELWPQILGNEEEPIAQSVRKLEDWGAEAIDINMGCPVQKALKHNYGVALMGDVKYAAKVVEYTARSTNLPVSVKLRAGEQNDFTYLLNFVRALVDSGANWITLHPRTAAQKRRGHADWEQIAKLKAAVSIPVIGNGDIQTVDDVFAMHSQTNCDMVMSGRALAARPWMLWQVGERMGFANPSGREGRAPQTRLEEGAEYGRALLRLLDYLELHFTPEQAMRRLRFYVRTTSVWLLFGQALISVTTKAKDLIELRAGISNFFEQEIEMVPKTDLRQ